MLADSDNLPFILALGSSVLAMPGLAAPNGIHKSIYSKFFSDLDGYFSANASGLMVGGKPVTTLDLYASYQNALISDSFLVPPNCGQLYWLSRQSVPAGLLKPGNVFAPATTFGAGVVGSGGAVAWTPGPSPSSIPQVNGANTQGYTASKGLTATVTTAIGGTLTLTVTGSGRSATGAAVTGRTWTAALDNQAAGAIVALVPAVAGDRIAAITSVAGSGAAASGAFSLQSILERVAG